VHKRVCGNQLNTRTENIQQPEPVHLRVFHHLVTMQANAYQNGAWVLAAAKAGREDESA
jgi:hypothetical protein